VGHAWAQIHDRRVRLPTTDTLSGGGLSRSCRSALCARPQRRSGPPFRARMAERRICAPAHRTFAQVGGRFCWWPGAGFQPLTSRFSRPVVRGPTFMPARYAERVPSWGSGARTPGEVPRATPARHGSSISRASGRSPGRRPLRRPSPRGSATGGLPGLLRARDPTARTAAAHVSRTSPGVCPVAILLRIRAVTRRSSARRRQRRQSVVSNRHPPVRREAVHLGAPTLDLGRGGGPVLNGLLCLVRGHRWHMQTNDGDGTRFRRCERGAGRTRPAPSTSDQTPPAASADLWAAVGLRSAVPGPPGVRTAEGDVRSAIALGQQQQCG
jgi:hypothetical protein